MPENSRRHDQYSESHTPSTIIQDIESERVMVYQIIQSRIWEIHKHRKQKVSENEDSGKIYPINMHSAGRDQTRLG